MYRRALLVLCGLGLALAGCTRSADTEQPRDDALAKPVSNAVATDRAAEVGGADSAYVRVVLNVSGMT